MMYFIFEFLSFDPLLMHVCLQFQLISRHLNFRALWFGLKAKKTKMRNVKLQHK
jgi:hypothetical protein